MRTDGVQRRKLLAAEIDHRGTTLREPAARPRIDRARRITLDQIACLSARPHRTGGAAAAISDHV
jgi:hypothetical protein